MSPEQITALQEIDLRSDLYSLACVLFECLAGQPPFMHRNEAVVLQMHLTQPAPDVRTLRPEIPAELAAGIARALAKTPEERWQTAAAMRDALAAVAGGLTAERGSSLAASSPDAIASFPALSPAALRGHPVTAPLDRLRSALGGRYAIERQVGEGGMATVYLARDLKHERTVAIKVLRPELSASLGADRFLREIRVAANLQHPNILGLYDSGEAGRAALLRHAVRRGRVAPRPAEPGAAAPAPATRSRSPARPPRRCSTPTSAASSTATSSRRTSCSSAATRWWPTSASPGR